MIDVRDFGAIPDGVTPCAAAFGAAAALAASSGATKVFVPTQGEYLIETSIVAPDWVEWVGENALLKAGSDDIAIFVSDAHSYFARFHGLVFDGGGHANITGLDLSNWRLSAGAYNCTFRNMDTGIIARDGCFGAIIENCTADRVSNAVVIPQNASGLQIINPSFDNGWAGGQTGVGVNIGNGSPLNVGVRILGGYIQGFSRGIVDRGRGTTISTYLENNTEADIDAIGAMESRYWDCVHPAESEGVAYQLRSCDAITIDNPLMLSGARSALYDIDHSNTNCVEYRPHSANGFNTPTGALDHIAALAIQRRGNFEPIVSGSGLTGTGTYTVAIGQFSITGDIVTITLDIAWTAHTGSGAIVISGIPAIAAPQSFPPARIGMVSITDMAVPGVQQLVQSNGSGADLSVISVDASGAASLIQLPASGGGHLSVSMTYHR